MDVLLVDLRLGAEHDRGTEAVEGRGRPLVRQPLDQVVALRANRLGKDALRGVAVV
jgi:hypothetical protein